MTTLHHVPLVCGILVGYNFGGFQLFSLLDSTLLYSLPLLVRRLPPPVTHFTIQEPEDDPRHFLYVWVARNGHQPQEMLEVVYISISYLCEQMNEAESI